MSFPLLLLRLLFLAFEKKKHDKGKRKKQGDGSGHFQRVKHKFIGFGIVTEAEPNNLADGRADLSLGSLYNGHLQVEGEGFRPV
jgi:hypothetical protein